MASSGGRDKLRSRGPRVFAFGSSTPRDLSHMNKVPPKLRNYDAKSVEKAAADSPNLHDYIVKARSLSREAGDSRNQFVFGSSTPRTLAHLDKIPQKQRVYDAKIPKKSATHSDFKAAPIRFNAPPTPVSKPVKKEEARHVITSKDDDIASEPDIVQDREEFLNEMRKHKKELEAQKSGPKTVPEGVEKAAETRQEHVKFAHAPEIAGNAQKAVRIQAETQEEAPVAVETLSANKMNDQIEVSQLLNEITPESVPAVESADSQRSANVVGDLLAKVERVAEEAVEKKEEVAKGIAEKVDDITKALEKSAKSLEETRDDVAHGVEKAFEAGEHKLESAFEDIKNGLTNVSLRNF